VFMTGTLRTHDPALRASAEGKLRRIVDGVAAAYGARAELEMIFGYPPVVNDGELAEAFAAYTRELGFNVERPAPTMGGEDFAYFAQRVPGVMVRLGIYNEAVGSVHSGHSPQFRLDEGAIPTGIATLVAFARGIGSGAVPVPAR
ncbi:MAG TPA: M20/M25/M40 family metallo-hydrolase, partial [Candidatus Elarobacter sp.]